MLRKNLQYELITLVARSRVKSHLFSFKPSLHHHSPEPVSAAVASKSQPEHHMPHTTPACSFPATALRQSLPPSAAPAPVPAPRARSMQSWFTTLLAPTSSARTVNSQMSLASVSACSPVCLAPVSASSPVSLAPVSASSPVSLSPVAPSPVPPAPVAPSPVPPVPVALEPPIYISGTKVPSSYLKRSL